MIQKRFPANTTLEYSTFLNNKKIDAELYAFLQSLSYPNEQGMTVVYKKDLPTQKEICSIIKVKSPKTYRSHLDYLIEQEYVIDKSEMFILPNKEDIFLMIPLDTLRFLKDTLQEQVIKIYIYLGQRYKFKPNYEFTAAELASHVGIKLEGNARGYEVIDNALLCLQKLGLIDYVVFYEGARPKRRLTKFSFEKPV